MLPKFKGSPTETAMMISTIKNINETYEELYTSKSNTSDIGKSINKAITDTAMIFAIEPNQRIDLLSDTTLEIIEASKNINVKILEAHPLYIAAYAFNKFENKNHYQAQLMSNIILKSNNLIPIEIKTDFTKNIEKLPFQKRQVLFLTQICNLQSKELEIEKHMKLQSVKQKSNNNEISL